MECTKSNIIEDFTMINAYIKKKNNFTQSNFTSLKELGEKKELGQNQQKEENRI